LANSPPHSPEKAIDQLSKAALCYLIMEGRGQMKKVTLLLPDKINRTLGTSRFSETDLIDLTPENLLLVLCDASSYHDSYKFMPEDVKISDYFFL
jgi:hypothetical protein